MNKTVSRFEILQQEISKMIEFSSSRAKRNKKNSFRIYISIAISSALITFLVAVGDDFKEYRTIIKILTLFFSASSTIFAAWDGFYNHKELWVIYGETRGRLKELELKTKLATEQDKNDPEYIDQIHKDFQSIVNHGSFKWKELRLEENGN